MKNKLYNIGHRGACGYEPENTLASFKKAIELGVDMIELDVYVLETGEVIVIHDDKVDRTTNGQGRVMEKSFEEIRNFDAGKGEKIPTLEEVLDLVNRKIKVNIELKGEKTAEPVFKIIKKYIKEKNWEYDDFFISSFNHIELKKFKNLIPEIKLGALTAGIPIDLAKFGEVIGAYSVNLCLDFINKEYIDDAHKRDLKVFVWTVNDFDDISRMKELGVDGVFTNYPDRIKNN